MSPTKERELWRRSRCGDREAFGRLLVRHSPRLKAVALAAGVPAADLGDAVQEAFVRALAHADDLRDESALAGWLGNIARNVAVDWRRRDGRERERRVDLDVASSIDGRRPPAVPADGRDAEIAGLAPDAAAILRLRYGESLSGPEIAARLGISLEAAKKRLQRARAAALVLVRGRPQ